MAAEGTLRNTPSIFLMAVLLVIPLAFTPGLVPAILGGAWWFAFSYVVYYVWALVTLDLAFVRSVEFRGRAVVLRRVFRSQRIEPAGVERLSLSRPVPYEVRPAKTNWGERESVLTIRFRGGKAIKMGATREEIKIRIFEAVSGKPYRGEVAWSPDLIPPDASGKGLAGS